MLHRLKIIFSRYFMAGLLVTLPVAITIWFLKALILWVDGFFQSFLPWQWQPEALLGYKIPGLGIVVTVTLVLIVGALTRFYLGKKLIAMGDRAFEKLPLGRTIYGGIKQVLSTVLSDQRQSFRRVAMVQWPNEFTYVIGFVTGEASGEVQEKTKARVFNVFIPTTPNPTSGYLIMVPQEKMIPLEMSVEAAVKLVISGGSIGGPPRQNV
ncbi:MAG: DUF502 domain-containing protein [bacterium]|nr:DUF502 domain-containing protein [bacterium]